MKKITLLLATVLLSVLFVFADDGQQGTGTKKCQTGCIAQQVEEQPIYVKLFKYLGLI